MFNVPVVIHLIQTFHYSALRGYGEIKAKELLDPAQEGERKQERAEGDEREEPEDVIQMGGDFTFNCQTGRLVFAYRY